MMKRLIRTLIWLSERPVPVSGMILTLVFFLLYVPEIDRAFPVIDNVQVGDVRYVSPTTIGYTVRFQRHKGHWQFDHAEFRYVFSDGRNPIPYTGRVIRTDEDGNTIRVVPGQAVFDRESFSVTRPGNYLETYYQFDLPTGAQPGDILRAWAFYRGPFPLNYYVNGYEFGEVVVPPMPEVPLIEHQNRIIRRQLEEAQGIKPSE